MVNDLSLSEVLATGEPGVGSALRDECLSQAHTKPRKEEASVFVQRKMGNRIMREEERKKKAAKKRKLE